MYTLYVPYVYTCIPKGAPGKLHISVITQIVVDVIVIIVAESVTFQYCTDKTFHAIWCYLIGSQQQFFTRLDYLNAQPSQKAMKRVATGDQMLQPAIGQTNVSQQNKHPVGDKFMQQGEVLARGLNLNCVEHTPTDCK